MIVNQIEVQRWGGVCGKYPVACVVRHLLRRAGIIKPFRIIKVIDMTYGQGIFWLTLPQALIIGFEPNVALKPLRHPWMLVHDKCQEWRKYIPAHFRPDLIAVDPPWSRHELRTRKHFMDNGEAEEILLTALQASRHYSAPLLVHFMERWIPEGTRVLAELWFQGRHRYSKQPKPTWFGVVKA